LAEILQESLATELKQRQYFIAQNVGLIVNRAIEDTPELTQLLRLIPIVGEELNNKFKVSDNDSVKTSHKVYWNRWWWEIQHSPMLPIA
jgi:hypothetical protein